MTGERSHRFRTQSVRAPRRWQKGARENLQNCLGSSVRTRLSPGARLENPEREGRAKPAGKRRLRPKLSKVSTSVNVRCVWLRLNCLNSVSPAYLRAMTKDS